MSASRSAPANRDTTAPMSRRGVAVGATAVILVIACFGAVAWYAGWFRWPEDPRVVAIGDLMRDLLEKERRRTGPATFMTAIERVSGIVTVGMKVNELPQDLRPRVMPLAMGVMMDHLDDRMNAYFALRTSEDRTRFIDGELAQMDFLKRAFEAQGKTGGGPDGRPGGDKGPRGPDGGPSSGPGQTREQRFTKWVLDRTTPEKRARLSEYIGAFERRIAQTGRKPL